MTDAQWAVLEPLLPVMLCLTLIGGRPEKHSRRTIIDALFYMVDNGIKWRAMPGDYPPWRTVYGYSTRWGGGQGHPPARRCPAHPDPGRDGTQPAAVSGNHRLPVSR
jgi:transposase